MSAGGRALENALLRAARYYSANGRQCFLQKQEHTPGRTYAHADLVGGVDGRSIALEAKMTAGDYFPLKPERAAQRKALLNFYHQGAITGLVIEFTDYREVYAIPWYVVQAFLNAAWVRHLSLDWCRANGLRLPLMDIGPNRKALFLSGFEPHGAAVSRRDVEWKRSQAKLFFAIDGDLEREAELDRRRNPQRTKGHEPISVDEAKARIRKATQDGIRRVSKANPRRGWMGGGR